MTNRFQEKFMRDLVQFSKSRGFIIAEGGVIEPINDWVDQSKTFKYITKENEDGNLVITGIENYVVFKNKNGQIDWQEG